MTCLAKHAKYQPTDEEWQCPKCGKGTGIFSIDWPDDDADDECELLHESDSLRCENCEHEMTGKAFSAWLIKKKSLVPCPHCKGTGFVKGK